MPTNSIAHWAPIFLFGFERSGTTLLTMLFGAHPAVAVPFSTTGLWYRYYHDWEKARSQDLICLLRTILKEERIRLWDFVPQLEDIADKVESVTPAAIVHAFHQSYADHYAKPLWGNSDINTLDYMHVANAMFPNARFVHIVRDVRDVVLSNSQMPYAVGNALDVARSWCLRVRTNLRMGAMIPKTRYTVVRYEDILRAPEATLRQACAQIQLGYDPRMLDYAEEVNNKVPENRKWLWPKLRGPIDQQNVERWRREMWAAEIQMIENQTKDLLLELGYPVLSEKRARISAIGLETWCTLSSGHRFQRLAEKLHRRLGM